jgi:hypothetical protein
VPEPVLEAAFVSCLSLFPGIGSKTIEPVVLVLSFVCIAVLELLLSLAMLEGVDEHTIVRKLIGLQSSLAVHYP